jgi:leucyl aminopeptidase
MKLSILNKQIQAVPADALIVNCFEDVTMPSGATAAVDTALGARDGMPGDGAISRLLKLGDFKGKLNEVAVIYANGLIPAVRVIVVGLGKASDFTLDRVRQASGAATRKARDLGCQTVASVVHGVGAGVGVGTGAGGWGVDVVAQATTEGAFMGAYSFREHKTQPDSAKGIELFQVIVDDARQVADVTRGAQTGAIIARAVNTARDLISRAPNVLNPVAMANVASTMAERVGLKATIFDEHALEEMCMGGVLAVSQGSNNPPRFVVLEHNPNTQPQSQFSSPLVFVGKGVTFDTGGISLKDPAGMESMKGDMGGAAAVLGAMQAVAELNVPRRVIGLMPMVENMPSDRAYRPGDVITMMSGLTVEIISTDAEGRLILADALHLAKQYKPAGVVDLATLTGACVVALGEGVAAGLFSNQANWAAQVLRAADVAGERLWHMPLYPEYGEKIRSDYAAIKNSGGRTGGVGTSAYFLKRFTENGDTGDAYPWAHIDMAGMVFAGDSKGFQPKGAMGYGVRLLVALASAAPMPLAEVG